MRGAAKPEVGGRIRGAGVAAVYFTFPVFLCKSWTVEGGGPAHGVNYLATKDNCHPFYR